MDNVFIFKISLSGNRFVLMQYEKSVYTRVVCVSSEKFFSAWHDSQKLDIVRTREKYPDAETAFAKSTKSPIPIVTAGMGDYDGKGRITIKLNDGITRTTWLINNGAQSFPLACSPCQLPDFLQLQSTKNSLNFAQSIRQPTNALGKPGIPGGFAGKLSSFLKLIKKLY